MDDKERFELARELIRHEDGLVNNRVTWLLVFQGLLFTAFVSGIGLYEKARPGAYVFIAGGLILVGLLGIASNLIARNVLTIAFRQTEAVRQWWRASAAARENFPPIAGALPGGWFYWLFATGRMPLILVAVWLVLILLALGGLCRIA